ncbi:hypothetical protein [Rhizobium sp. No.120]
MYVNPEAGVGGRRIIVGLKQHMLLQHFFFRKMMGVAVRMAPNSAQRRIENNKQWLPITLARRFALGKSLPRRSVIEPEQVLLWRVTRSLTDYHAACGAI